MAYPAYDTYNQAVAFPRTYSQYPGDYAYSEPAAGMAYSDVSHSLEIDHHMFEHPILLFHGDRVMQRQATRRQVMRCMDPQDAHSANTVVADMVRNFMI